MPPMMAASTYRLEFFSDAKISIIPETSKHFSIFFRWNKNKGTQALKTCVPFVLSYYNNYLHSLHVSWGTPYLMCHTYSRLYFCIINILFRVGKK